MRARTKTLSNGWLALCAIASTVAAASAVDEKPAGAQLARFAIIYPEADPAAQEKPAGPKTSWLLQPKSPARKSSAALPARSRPATSKTKADSRVTPLRRDRPKHETDPPKTRRPQLGW